MFVQAKSNEEGVGEGEAALLKQITDLLYSTEVSLLFHMNDDRRLNKLGGI